MFFTLGIAAVLICVIIAIVYLVGGSPGPPRQACPAVFGLAVIAALFAAVNRPVGTRT
jgi:hypothetical protein